MYNNCIAFLNETVKEAAPDTQEGAYTNRLKTKIF